MANVQITSNCSTCNKEFQTNKYEIQRGWGRFCSRSCGIKYSNTDRLKRPKQPNVKCSACGLLLYRKPFSLTKTKNFFCNRNCQSHYRRRKGQAEQRKRGYSKTRKIKEQVLTLRTNQCQICKWHETICDVHHITPVREGGQTTEQNLIVLCPNHHRLADRNKISREKLSNINNL